VSDDKSFAANCAGWIDRSMGWLGVAIVATALWSVNAVLLVVSLLFGRALLDGELSAVPVLAVTVPALLGCCYLIWALWRDSSESRLAIIGAAALVGAGAAYLLSRPFIVIG
jgi:hypothetical protein